MDFQSIALPTELQRRMQKNIYEKRTLVNSRRQKQKNAVSAPGKKTSASRKARHFIASLKGRGIRLRGFSNRLRPSEGKKCRLLFFPLTFFLPQSFIIIDYRLIYYFEFL